MAIQSLCKTDIVTATKKTTLKEISQLMKDEHVGCVVIVESYNGKRVPSGIITDRDIALTVNSNKKPQDLLAKDIMHSPPVTIKSNEGLYETIVKMKNNGIKRLPVVDDKGSLCGVVSSDNLLDLMAEEMSNLAKIGDTQVKREQGIQIPLERQIQV